MVFSFNIDVPTRGALRSNLVELCLELFADINLLGDGKSSIFSRKPKFKMPRELKHYEKLSGVLINWRLVQCILEHLELLLRDRLNYLELQTMGFVQLRIQHPTEMMTVFPNSRVLHFSRITHLR